MFASYSPSRRPASPVKGSRKVFDNSMVAHVWAQQSQSEGRSNNGNFYFRDSTIYSYGSHFPIAKFSKDKSVVWFTTRGYSVSTAGHIRYTQDALRGLPVVIVPLPCERVDYFDESHVSKEERATIELELMRRDNSRAWDAFQRVTGKPNRAYPANAVQLVERHDAKIKAAALAGKLGDARDAIDLESIGINRALIPVVSNEAEERSYPTPYYVATDSASRVESLRFKIMSARATLSRQSTKSKADIKRIRTASDLGKRLAAIRDVWRNTVKAMEESRDYERDQSEIANALEAIASGKPRVYWFESGVGDNRTTETEIISARIRRAFQVGFTFEQIEPLWQILQGRLYYRESDSDTEEASNIRHARRYGYKRITATDWQNGKGDKYQSYATTLVRRVGDTLQTSRGAECPFAHAVVAFLKAQECRRNGTTWQRNGQQIRVGHFNVDSIDASGNMVAGCHTLQWEEMLRLAIREIPERVKPSFGLPALLVA